ncbi:hypothetical protein B0I37DRAFT_423103 [Chaetomium sp. MPI-CAGE-AT-0009]|nr:hypothetical protein B0I37DRAFT_423103 [Chaetomium sp. MPI-CAGE-AT-0009]
MCYIPKNIYTLTFRSCRPVELAKLKYWFCPECREHYKAYDTNGAEAILNYWAYKALCGFTHDVSPGAIPGDVVFNGTVPGLAASTKLRCELVALDKAWPHSPFETKVEWLRRLERARLVTLELARTWSGTRACAPSSEISIQPRVPSPMSAYPFSYVHDHSLSAITEASDSLKSVPNPPSWRETVHRETPQVHLNTLAKLCGDSAPSVSGSLPPWPEEAQSSRLADPTLFEVPLNPTEPWAPPPVDQEIMGEESHHASVELARPLSRQVTEQFNQQQRSTQPDFTGSETSGPGCFSDRSGEVSGSMSNGKVPRTGFDYWDHEAWVEDLTSTDSVEPAQEVLRNKPERPPQANDEQVDDWTNSFSAEPVQNSPYRAPAELPLPDSIPSNEAVADVTLDEANARDVTQEQDGPSTTSRFFVSDLDPDEAAERASIASVSSVGEDEDHEVPALDDSDTTTPVFESEEEQECKQPEKHDSAIDVVITCPTPEIVSPEPNRTFSPPRFVREDGGSTARTSDSDIYWNEFENRLAHGASLSPGMMGVLPQRMSTAGACVEVIHSL